MAKQNKVVLAEGEATGHAHVASGKGVRLDDDVLSAPSGARVVHQEHDEFQLPPETYDRLIVREYDHFEEEAREVMD